MPTWSEILKELNETTEQGNRPPKFDDIRRKYLATLYKHTGRETILYATKCTQLAENISPDAISIVDEDIQGIMEVIHGLTGKKLDLILHSPGGSLESVEAFVCYLRSKFSDIRVIVPQIAMSAATMIACAANKIVLGKHSFLGPVDPQIIVGTPLGPRMVPTQAILDQFKLAKEECADPAKLAAWLPMLSQYGPDLLVQCENALKLSSSLVRSWLETYMFVKDRERTAKAKQTSKWLCNHRYFKTHGRHIPRAEIEKRGLIIEHLESDQSQQDLVLSVFHATTHTFSGTPAVKIIENHLGKAFIKQARPLLIQMPGEGGGAIVPPPTVDIPEKETLLSK